MRAWLVRAGRFGEREQLALDESLAAIGWEELADLSGIQDRQELAKLVRETYPAEGEATVVNWIGQLWTFLGRISPGDLVVLPLKARPVVAIGRVLGPYQYRPDLPEDARHTRPVEWLRTDVPRTALGQDLRNSLGSLLTVCELKRNDAVNRLKAIAAGGDDPGLGRPAAEQAVSTDEKSVSGLESVARERIVARIAARFGGHGLARLVEAIFRARGMITFRSPQGPDGGVDVLCGSGPFGMDPPRICVQVKFTEAPADVRTVRELEGVMGRLRADQGLLVSWNGLTREAERELRQQFFKVRLWTADDLLRELTEVYDRLPEEIQAELPLKRIWVLADEETSG